MKTVLYVWLVLLGFAPSIRAACPSTTVGQTYPFTARLPSGCQQSACTFFLGVTKNANDPNYLDFWMEGTATGYTAVGFSADGLMASSDVIMCGVDATAVGGVGIVDAYNSGYNSVRDTTQNVCPYSVSFTNGRIVCSFSKLIKTGDTTQDVVLNGTYHLLQVATTTPPSGSGATLAPSYHATTPPISAVVNIVSYLFSPTSAPPTSTTVPPARSNTTGPHAAPLVATCPAFGTDAYRFTATIPDSCQQSSCDFYLGVRTNKENPQYLDFWMEGNANGYIAVGFSPSGQMVSQIYTWSFSLTGRIQTKSNSDVVMCGVDSTLVSGVGYVDAYNPSYSSVRDSIQNLCPSAASFTNGRIKCSFSRLINTGDTDQDKMLDVSHYLLLAAVNNAPIGSGSTLAPSSHPGETPHLSAQAVNIAQFTGVVASSGEFPKTALTKVHGIMMLISWPLLAVTGIFFAAWMKPALGPPPMPPKWFTIHRVLMLASMFIGAAGFVFIFIANYKTNGKISLDSSGNLAHFLVGIFVMFLHIINPIISAFRCLPTSSRRWIFNLLHGSLIGLAVEMLALINCGIGVSLFESNGYSSSPGSYRSLGIYVTYVVLLFLLFVALFSMFTGIAIVTGGEKGLKLGPAVIKPILEYYIGEKKVEPTLFKNATSEIPGTEASVVRNAQETKPATPPPSPSPATPATKPPKSKDVVLRWIGLTFFLCITIPFILIVIVLVAV